MTRCWVLGFNGIGVYLLKGLKVVRSERNEQDAMVAEKRKWIREVVSEYQMVRRVLSLVCCMTYANSLVQIARP